MLYREVVIVCFTRKKRTEHIDTLCGQNAVISGGKYTNHYALKCCIVFSQIKEMLASELFKSLSKVGSKCSSCRRIFRT
jgi:hypothetical protein